MDQAQPQRRSERIPLKVLPDQRRLERIFRNAQAWQEQVAGEAKEKQMSQTEVPVASPEQADCGAGFQPASSEEKQADSLHHNNEQSPAPSPHPGKSIEKKLLEGKIIELLRTIYDPELPVNIYDLGLIYDIDISDDHSVNIRMTLTAPACPVAGQIVAEVQAKVQNLDEVKRADVELVWDPPWGREMISEAARLDLGLL